MRGPCWVLLAIPRTCCGGISVRAHFLHQSGSYGQPQFFFARASARLLLSAASPIAGAPFMGAAMSAAIALRTPRAYPMLLDWSAPHDASRIAPGATGERPGQGDHAERPMGLSGRGRGRSRWAGGKLSAASPSGPNP